ncbi:MAG: O-antigen ligase family protein [Patescibacteria group bacterium]
MPLLIILYSLFFVLITWLRFRLSLFFLFLLLPTYLIRFNIGPLPTTLLEAMIWIIIAVWIVKRFQISNFRFQILRHKILFIGSFIFLVAATASIFTSVDVRAAAGEWKAFYIEPFLIFIILITTINNQQSTTKSLIFNLQSLILFALILSGLATSLLAIYQHFTGFMVPYAFWENGNAFRVTGWYGFPNAVGLFLAPIVPIALYLLIQSFQRLKKRNWKLETGNWLTLVSSFLFLISSPLAIIFAKSTGGLAGLAAGIALLLFFYKKTRLITIILLASGLLTLALLPAYNPIKKELTLQDRSGQIRLSIYQETWQFLKDNPIFGAGLASYKEKIIPYHTAVNGEGIEIFHHPHNIFLTMWVGLGLTGLVGFLLIMVWFFKTGIIGVLKIKRLKDCKIKDNTSSFQSFNLSIFLLASMTAIVVTGLVDSPYIKNDLAILFWLLPALLIATSYQQETSV